MLSAFHKCVAKAFLSGGKPEGMPSTLGHGGLSDGFFWGTKPPLVYGISCHSWGKEPVEGESWQKMKLGS